MKRTTKLNVRLPDEVVGALRLKSKLTGLPIAAIVRHQVERALDREDEQQRSSVRAR